MQIPFPVSSRPGVKPQEGGGWLVNCFAQKAAPGARFEVIWRRSVGSRLALNITGHSHLRGSIVVGSTLLLVLDTRVYAVTESGGTLTATNLGALSGTDQVTIAKNNASTANIALVCSAGMFNLFTNSAPTTFADGDLPASNSVSHMDGYLLFTTSSGAIWATGLNAVTVATNSFTTAQGRSDGLLRGVAFRKEFFAFGNSSIEVYRNAATSPFPLEFVLMIPRGIVGTHAVSGWEEGWANDLIWVADDNIVYRLDGYTPVRVSNEDVERYIEQCEDRTKLEASVYMNGGNAFWVLTDPGNWTWEYNKTTGEWNQRESYGRDDWAMSCAVKAFNNWYRGDRTTGKLFKLDNTYHREGDDALVAELVSGVVHNFPAQISNPRADFDITAAVGSISGLDPIETAPRVEISWSNDGGYIWGNPVTRQMGAEGESKRAVTVLRTGKTTAKGKRFKLRVSDPVHFGFMGGQLAVKQLKA